ncbi:MAG: ATP synthase F1 subunit delta [Balneolales bacterium]
MSAKAARRYSTALLSLAAEKQQTDQVLKDIGFIRRTILDSRELTLFLDSKIINQDKKQAVLTELFYTQVSTLTREFLTFLVSKNREELLPDITKTLLFDYNKAAGILDVQIAHSGHVDENHLKSIKSVLEDKTGKKINFNLKKDASLMGGITVKIDDTVIDGSVKNKIKKLESLFMGSAV